MDTAKKQSQIKQRMPYIDVYKAIAMISVVMFHACTNHANTYLATNAYLIRFTSAYALPAFFFINGFLYKNKDIDNPILALWKRIKAYFIPFICYNLIYLFLHNVFVALHMVDETYGNGYYDLKEFAKHFVLAITGHREFFSGALWFLGSILTMNAIYIVSEYVIHKLLHDKYRLVILTIVTLICVFAGNSGYVTNAMKIATSLSNLCYFFFGMLVKQKDWNTVFLKKKYVYITLALLFNLMISYNKLYNPFRLNSSLLFIALDYINAFICIIGILMIVQFKYIANSRFLQVIGKNTMDIMALHFMIFKLVSVIIIGVYGLPITRLAEYPVLMGVGGGWWLAYTAVGVAIPTLFSVFRHKIFKKRSV